MIQAELDKNGVIKLTGELDLLLTEYTLITRIILHQLSVDHDKETAFKILAGIGQVAASNMEKLGGDVEGVYTELMKVLKDEL